MKNKNNTRNQLFQGWFNFEGQRGRLNYLGVVLLQLIAVCLTFALLIPSALFTAGLPIFALAAVVIWCSASVTTQRLRDAGMTKLWQLILTNILAYLTGVLYLVIMIWPPRQQ